ncbi:hypothetical protein Hdeb2414_s0007g00236201 [Helianthus debilis subsp. tardiflorus]
MYFQVCWNEYNERILFGLTFSDLWESYCPIRFLLGSLFRPFQL